MEKRSLTIDVNIDLLAEELEYIFDCWVAFVTCDLGYKVQDLPMYETEARNGLPTTA
jgi:hypothetical protein